MELIISFLGKSIDTMAYLLKCEKCEAETPVELGMSGETIRCDNCQALMEVPLLRILRTMPRTASTDAVDYWSWRHSIIFTGALIGLIGLVLSISLGVRISRQSMIEFENKTVEMSLQKSWQIWTRHFNHGEAGIVLPENHPRAVQIRKETQERAELERWQYLTWAITALGFLTLCAGFFFPFNIVTGESRTTISHKNYQASQKARSKG